MTYWYSYVLAHSQPIYKQSHDINEKYYINQYYSQLAPGGDVLLLQLTTTTTTSSTTFSATTTRVASTSSY